MQCNELQSVFAILKCILSFTAFLTLHTKFDFSSSFYFTLPFMNALFQYRLKMNFLTLDVLPVVECCNLKDVFSQCFKALSTDEVVIFKGQWTQDKIQIIQLDKPFLLTISDIHYKIYKK